jgi:hypothetical protein
MENLTEDGGVVVLSRDTSHVSPENLELRPPLHARCFVHYVGTIVKTGEKFMDTKTDR